MSDYLLQVDETSRFALADGTGFLLLVPTPEFLKIDQLASVLPTQWLATAEPSRWVARVKTR